MNLDQTAGGGVISGGGSLGTTLDYLEDLIEHLALLEIEDPAMTTLAARARAMAKKEA